MNPKEEHRRVFGRVFHNFPSSFVLNCKPSTKMSFYRMFWPTLMCISLVAGCRMGKFVKQEGIALENHVISVVTADHPVKCKQDCLDTPLCFSINVHAQTLLSGWVKCDLNNSTRAANPENLVQRAGYWYHQMTVSVITIHGFESPIIGLLTIEIYSVNSAIHLSTTGAKVATILNAYSPSSKFSIDFFSYIFFSICQT